MIREKKAPVLLAGALLSGDVDHPLHHQALDVPASADGDVDDMHTGRQFIVQFQCEAGNALIKVNAATHNRRTMDGMELDLHIFVIDHFAQREV